MRSLSKLRRGLAISKDPSRTGRHIERYAAKLRGMLNKTRKAVIEILIDKLNERQMATYTVDVKTFKEDLAKVVEINWRKPAEEEGKEVIWAQMKRAGLMVDNTIDSFGMDMMIGNMPVDIGVYNNIEERNLTELMGIGDDYERKIIEELTAGIDAGEGIRDISKRISEVTGFEQSRATMVARTETMYAFNKVAEEKYSRYGIEQLQWKTGGANVCDNVTGFDGVHYSGGCQGLDGKIYDVGAHPPCPLHPNCKCILDAVVPEVV